MTRALRFGATAILVGVLAVLPAFGEAERATSAPPIASGQTAAAKGSVVQRAIAELTQWVEAQGGRLGASVIDVATGTAVAAHADRLPLNPASTMKIVTAAAALDVLGPEYVY